MPLQSFDLAVPTAAFFSTIVGLLTLNSLFKNKIKELFDDRNYFIFFFLTIGYVLYALGELSWFLMFTLTGGKSPKTIADVYWTAGTLAMAAAFIALAMTLYKEHRSGRKLWGVAGIGVIIFSLVLYFLFSGTVSGDYIFNYYYPLASSLIVAFSSSIIFYYPQLTSLKKSLLLLFFANIAILGGDLFFAYSSTSTASVAKTISDGSYIIGYVLSGLFFIAAFFALHNHQKPQA